MMILDRSAEWLLPNYAYGKVKHLIKYILFGGYRKNCMRKKVYGRRNPDKTFYVLRMDNPCVGILSAYLVFLDELQKVDEKGYVPVYDFKNTFLPLLQDQENAYHENAWDYYFESLHGCSKLNEVYQSRNVILGWNNWSMPNRINWMEKILCEDEVKRFNALAIKYMDFHPDIKKRANAFLSKIPTGKKVLGIALRANFLRGELVGEKIFDGHPRQKTLEETIDIVNDILRLWQCDYIFISVEDREWLEKLKEEFAGKCFWLERELIHSFKDGKPITDAESRLCELKNITVKKRNFDYLTEIYILAQCDGLFGSLSSGMTVAQILNNCKYEHIEISYNGAIKVQR